ncbi:MAG: tetratricopeptide repeat protein [Agarilytica sp.]
MKNILLTFGVAVCCLGSAVVLADQSNITDIENAGLRGDVKALRGLVQSEYLYDAALAQYRLAIIHKGSNELNEARQALIQSMERLEVLTSEEPSNAEAWALLSLVYGTQIGVAPELAGEYGPKAGRSIAKAKALAPENPRVNLVAGINDYFTPTMFGGSKMSALEALDSAAANYTGDEDSGYHWGVAEAYVWRGLVQMELGEREKALSDWRAAVAIEPNYHWANALLNKNQ